MNIERYGIYPADLNPTQGGEMNKIRPVVVVSMNEMNSALNTVVICPLTTKLHSNWRGRIQLTSAGKSAEIAVDQIRTVSKHRLIKRLDTLSNQAVFSLRHLISEMYGES